MSSEDNRTQASINPRRATCIPRQFVAGYTCVYAVCASDQSDHQSMKRTASQPPPSCFNTKSVFPKPS
jgi:hypothetical protein